MAKHHYISFGKGEKILLCFHGYEQNSSMFSILNEDWQKRYTIYAFDLFHHGKSEFQHNRIPNYPLTKSELKAYFEIFFTEKNITNFEIIGYSLGSRIGLYLAYVFPQKVKGIYLFAPDGFKKMPLQNFIEHNFFGIYLFKTFVRKPKPFHLLIKSLRKIKIIKQRLHDFVLRKTTLKQQRIQLYRSWQTYKCMHLSSKKISNLLQNIPKIVLLFGKYDAVIPLANLNKHKIDKESIICLNKGHDLFDKEALQILQKRLDF